MPSQETIIQQYPWINCDLFEKALQQDHPDCVINIENYSIETALPAGENFTSQLIRASVKYNINKLTNDDFYETRFIIKAELTNETAKNGFESMKLFEREIILFQYVIPEVCKLLKQFNENIPIAPKCYEANLEKSYIIFEDLTLKEYFNVDQRNGLAMDHFKCMLSKLARWHAATTFLEPMIRNHSKLFEAHPMVNNLILKSEVRMHIKILSQLTTTMPGYENISKKLENISELFYSKIIKSFNDHDSCLTALCHGDLWTNNIMFKYNSNGQPIDSIIIDYQFSNCGPIVNDLANVLYTSSDESFRETDWNELIQFYHTELIKMLIKLNYSHKLPSLSDLKIELNNRGICAAAIGLYEFAARGYIGHGEMNIADLMGDLNDLIIRRLQMFEKAKFNETFKFMLNYFDAKDYFNI